MRYFKVRQVLLGPWTLFIFFKVLYNLWSWPEIPKKLKDSDYGVVLGTWLQSLSCWWAQCFFGMISWKWVTERMLTFWFGVMAFMIDTGWVENCGLLTLAVLVFELVLHLWPSAICALTVVASLAYSIARWQQWQHVSLPLRVSLCWLTTLFMGSMPRVLCRCLYIIWVLLWQQQQQPLLTDVLPYPHPWGDIVSPLIDLELDEGQALLLTLSDTPT